VRRLLFGATETIAGAFGAIRGSKGRSALTVLGVAIGVFVVVVLTSVVQGMRESIVSSLLASGADSFTLYATEGMSSETCRPGHPCASAAPLTEADVRAIASSPEIAVVAASGSGSVTDAYRDRSLPRIRLEAVEAPWFDFGIGHVATGRPFTREEDRAGARVVLVDTTLARLLFDAQDPVGRTITVSGVPMAVIGTYVGRTYSGMMMMSSDIPATMSASAVVPLRTARRYLGVDIDDITVRPRSSVSREQGIAATTAALRIAHRLGPRAANDFEILNPAHELALLDDQTRTLRITLFAFSSVGLLVGGVGVIAIMLISVTERTREIGLRKALGARRALIAWQFLVEATTMTALGAIVGLAGGLGAVTLVRSLTRIPAVAPIDTVAVALGVSVVVGLAFGLLPAIRAAKLDPVEALRHE
jgi:putative ABC transport system permease protein